MSECAGETCAPFESVALNKLSGGLIRCFVDGFLASGTGDGYGYFLELLSWEEISNRLQQPGLKGMAYRAYFSLFLGIC